MRGMSTSQAGVVDAVLSSFARGYANADFVAARLFPGVPVPARNIRVLKFGKEGWRKLNTRRAPGAPILSVTYGYASDPASLVQDALQGLVPVETAEEASRIPGVNLGSHAIAMAMEQLDLGLEIDSAALARDPASYGVNNKVTLAGADKWTDAGSDPKGDVDAAKEAVRRQIGRYPNRMVIGPAAFLAATNHPKVKEQFKYTSADSVTEAMLARYFGVDEVVQGKGVYLPAGALDDDPALDIWGADVVLAYVPTAGNWMVPSFGYTYNLAGYPAVEAPWYDRDIRSWKYPTTVERRPYLVSADAGFLIQNAA